MQRIYVISLSDLDYEKKDLNVPFSQKRESIGLLSRIITNAIFLSHSLREKVIVRIFIEKPISHIIQIDSATIRYLGPELRSLASLILKAKKKFLDALSNDYFANCTWLEANPGFFISPAINPFQDLIEKSKTKIPLIYLFRDFNSENLEIKQYTMMDFEQIIDALSENSDTFIMYLSLDKEQNSKIPVNQQDFLIKKAIVLEKIDLAKIINIINIILDKK